MDRNTLSHYGWIVVLVLILACLLAFASPFGMFVADGIKSFTGGFVDTNNAAVDQIDPNAGKIPADECSHENIELQNQKSASCAYNGYTGDKVCTDCGTKMETGTVTAKLDHTPVTDNAVPATCEQEGKTEGSHCSVCKTTLVAQRTTDALGHDWGEPFVAEEATCLGNGISRIECQREGCDAHTDSSIKAEGHAVVTVKGKAATCTATGLTNGEKCSVCGTVTKEQQVIPANGHTEVNDSAIQASCEVAGKTAGVHCSVCNTVIKAQETVPALGHDMGNPLVTLTATCTSEGQTKTSCKRTGCGYYEVDTIEATGHSLVTDKAVAATCTATGLEEGSHCTQCSYRVSQATTPALGHEYSDFYTVTEMTCTVDGVQRKDCERDGCDHYETLTTTAPGHKEVTDLAVAPTCTATGLTAGTHCSVCNKVLTAQTVVPANGHTEVIDKAVSATCLDTGLTEGKHCSVCNTVLVAQTTVEALGHDTVKDNAVAATCTKTGLTEGEHCSRCDYKIAQTTTSALGHEYNSVTKEATCTEGGSTITTCSRCGDSSTTTTAALGHNYIAKVTTEATCTTTGVRTYTCSRCGNSYTESIAATGHLHTEIRNADTSTGYTGDTYCKDCGKIISYGKYIIPEGGTYTTADGTVYEEGDAFPSTVTDGDTYSYGEYEYKYNYRLYSSPGIGRWEASTSQNGWGVRYLYDRANPAQMLESINGKPITSMRCTFYQCRSVVVAPAIPSTVTDMYHAFANCYKLTTVGKLPSGLKNLIYAFSGCRVLTKAPAIPSTVTEMSSCFSGCKALTDISEVRIPNGVTDITNIFNSCAFTSINLRSNTSITIVEGFNNNTSLKSVILPSNTRVINTYAFSGCTSLTSITLPNSVTYIGLDSFENCTSLTSITIPASVKSIRACAFENCTSLTTIKFNGTTTQWNAISLDTDWNSNVPATEVICSDGTVSLS